MVAVIDDISVEQRRGGAQQVQVRHVVSHLLCQRDPNSSKDRPTVQLLIRVQYGAAETGSRLRRHQVPLKEESDKGCGE